MNRPTRAASTGKTAQRNQLAAKRVAVVRAIRSLPRGKVSSYGAVARAAGWPGAARQVVRILQQVQELPWHRVVGSGGAIKLPGESGAEQKLRLRMEDVSFHGARVNMKLHEFNFSSNRKGKHKRR